MGEREKQRNQPNIWTFIIMVEMNFLFLPWNYSIDIDIHTHGKTKYSDDVRKIFYRNFFFPIRILNIYIWRQFIYTLYIYFDDHFYCLLCWNSFFFLGCVYNKYRLKLLFDIDLEISIILYWLSLRCCCCVWMITINWFVVVVRDDNFSIFASFFTLLTGIEYCFYCFWRNRNLPFIESIFIWFLFCFVCLSTFVELKTKVSAKRDFPLFLNGGGDENQVLIS